MRELEGVNEIFRSKYEANPKVRDIIDKAKKLDTRSLIDVMGKRKNSRGNRRPSWMDRGRRRYYDTSKRSSTNNWNRSSRTYRRGRKIECTKYSQIYTYT